MSTPSFSALFEQARQGDWSARDLVYRLAFQRLRSIASSLLRRERRGHTLQPTALVGELFLKFHRLQALVIDEEHFFHLSARAMRQVLIDYARSRGARALTPESIAELLRLQHHGPGDLELSLSVRTVFNTLERLDPTAARTVWLRSVEGLTLSEIAAAQARDMWRVRADYDFGTQWMADRLARRPLGRIQGRRDLGSPAICR